MLSIVHHTLITHNQFSKANFAHFARLYNSRTGHILNTIHIRRIPAEILVMLVFLLTVMICGWIALFIEDAMLIEIGTTMLVLLFMLVVTVYTLLMLFFGRRHFQRNLLGLDSKVNTILKVYTIVPNAISLLLFLYSLSRADEMWNARVSVDKDIENPGRKYCGINNLGTSYPSSNEMFTHCIDDLSSFGWETTTSNLDECNDDASEEGSVFYAFNNETHRCQVLYLQLCMKYTLSSNSFMP